MNTLTLIKDLKEKFIEIYLIPRNIEPDAFSYGGRMSGGRLSFVVRSPDSLHFEQRDDMWYSFNADGTSTPINIDWILDLLGESSPINIERAVDDIRTDCGYEATWVNDGAHIKRRRLCGED